MIGYISGKIVFVDGQRLIIKPSNGVGYIVTVKEESKAMVNEQIELFILQVQREDKTDLYGFDHWEERQWVEKLLKVSGVGPKMAVNVLHSIGIDAIQSAILKTDHKTLTEVKGLGAKTAKKIVLELKGAVTDLTKLDAESKTGSKSKTSIEFTETLSNLGFKRGNIVAAIAEMKADGIWDDKDLVSMVKRGLKYVSKG